MRVLLAAAIAVTASGAATVPPAPADTADRARAEGAAALRAGAAQEQRRRLQGLARRVRHHRVATWRCQDELGERRVRAARPASALPPSLDYRRWVAGLWRTRARRCALLRARTIPLVATWQEAVRAAQRVFPGTDGWLLACSGGEGGHGGFVMNHQGSGAGGWMQFVYSTYAANADDAFAAARGKGFRVDPRANDWRHPLGQALTAAYMRSRGWSATHWDPRVDPACR